MGRHTHEWFRRKRTLLPPDQPLAPFATNVTANGATINWVVTPGATFHTVERSTDNVSFTQVYTGSDFSFDDTGLSNTSLYYYRLVAGNPKGGLSVPSETTIITLDTATPPATPTAPTYSAVTSSTITIDWNAVSLANTYRIERALVSGGGYSIEYGPGTALSFTDSNLTASTAYQYRVVAINGDGETTGPSAPVTTATAPVTPPVPAQPTASQITSSSVNISWVAVAGANEYELQSRQTAPVTTSFATIYGPGPQTSFQALGLNANSTYEFKVRASNQAGTSAYSVVRTITTGNNTGTNVQPVSILELRQNSGVATHPNFGTGVFKPANAPEYVDFIYQAGFGFIRGNFANENVFAPLLRARNMKWICGVTTEGSSEPTNQTVAETRAKVRDIREGYADIIAGIEGINEPNHNRGTGSIVLDWADKTMNHQRAIWQESQWNLTSVNGPIGSSPTAGAVTNPLKGIKIYGPSLHDIACENSYDGTANTGNGGPRHWHQLLDLGIKSNQDAAGFHCYPGGGIPLRGARNRALLGPESESGNVTGRLELMWSAYGQNYPSYTTEWGYHNAVAQSGGHIGIDERGSGIYAPRGFIQFYTQPYRIGGVGLANNTACTWFEALDDQDDGAKNSQEANFGIYGYNDGTDATVPSNWRPKPQYNSCKNFFRHFAFESLTRNAYIPARVQCSVSTTATNDNLEWQVLADATQSAAGTATVAIYRNMRCWDRGNKTIVNVPTIPVRITDRVGLHSTTYQIGAPVTLIDLR